MGKGGPEIKIVNKGSGGQILLEGVSAITEVLAQEELRVAGS